MIRVHVEAISLIAPGLSGWRESLPVLRGDRPYAPEPLLPFAPELLPRNERRRVTPVIKLAIQAAEQLVVARAPALQELRSVFASSGGDGEIINNICLALASPERTVSPTQFHNSVHNGPAGYWTIATECRMPSVSLSAYDGSFAAGLLEAATLAVVEGGQVLLVAYDYPPPAPASEVRCFRAPFATAMLLNAERFDRSLARLTIETMDGWREDQVEDERLECLRTGNPAARALPLLRAIARQTSGRVVLPYLPDMPLAVGIEPTSSS
jgi:hypothetical protein